MSRRTPATSRAAPAEAAGRGPPRTSALRRPARPARTCDDRRRADRSVAGSASRSPVRPIARRPAWQGAHAVQPRQPADRAGRPHGPAGSRQPAARRGPRRPRPVRRAGEEPRAHPHLPPHARSRSGTPPPPGCRPTRWSRRWRPTASSRSRPTCRPTSASWSAATAGSASGGSTAALRLVTDDQAAARGAGPAEGGARLPGRADRRDQLRHRRRLPRASSSRP